MNDQLPSVEEPWKDITYLGVNVIRIWIFFFLAKEMCVLKKKKKDFPAADTIYTALRLSYIVTVKKKTQKNRRFSS